MVPPQAKDPVRLALEDISDVMHLCSLQTRQGDSAAAEVLSN